MFAIIGVSVMAQAWRGLCAISAGLADAAQPQLVMKPAALLVDPKIAGHHAENQTAALRRIAVVGSGVNVKPDESMWVKKPPAWRMS